jgi:hypothetical protein
VRADAPVRVSALVHVAAARRGRRLPTTDTGPTSNCSLNLDPGGGFPPQYFGYGCTGSEMGHLWYTELLNRRGASR